MHVHMQMQMHMRATITQLSQYTCASIDAFAASDCSLYMLHWENSSSVSDIGTTPLSMLLSGKLLSAGT